MSVESIPIYSLLRSILSWLPPVLLKWYYSADRLGKLIYFDFLPRCESARVDLGNAASVHLTLQLINLSPFTVEFDRARLEFLFGGSCINVLGLDQRSIAPGESSIFSFREAIPDGHADQMAKHIDKQGWLQGNIGFNCRIRQFSKNLGSMSGVQISAINTETRNRRADINHKILDPNPSTSNPQ